ncbi:MAG: alpha/beta fold hydrolase [Rhodobacteraceae bacterium]|nr:alpha/beta fold hydrolase [Paracoccaceae bacterium]
MDYVFCARNVRIDSFGTDPGRASFLAVPEAATVPLPAHRIPKRDWVEAVTQDAINGQNPATLSLTGDILFFVHGFNTPQETMLRRHRLLRAGLGAQGWDGCVVSFDWPCATSALNYLEDRTDAKLTALRLVDEGIATFARIQRPECEIRLHILAHSMGAFVVREAFDDADDRPGVAQHAWTVSQTVFIGADVSSLSMAEGHARSSSLYRHTVRLTNYFNPFDAALSLSNVKRVGVAPRAGRVGLPPTAPAKAADVDCGPHYERTRAAHEGRENPGHTWYFHDALFMRDLAFTLAGEIDRASIPTRAAGPKGLILAG